MRIEFDLRPGIGADAIAELSVNDLATGEPVRGLRPLGWMSSRKSSPIVKVEDCKQRIRQFAGGLLSARPVVDMNAYMLLSLNSDRTITVINPQLAFGRTKLRSLIDLPGDASDWAASKDQRAIFVAIPSKDAIARIDATEFKLQRLIPAGPKPERVAISQLDGTLWVSQSGDGKISAFDPVTGDPLASVPVGRAPHSFVFSRDGKSLWALAGGDGQLVEVDSASREKKREVAVPRKSTLLASSDHSGWVVVGDSAGGRLLGFGASTSGRFELKLEPGLSAIAFDRTGRWLFALNRKEGTVSIVDGATGRLAHRIGGFKGPDAIAFTESVAYVRNADTSFYSLITLTKLDQPVKPGVTDVLIGESSPGRDRKGLAVPIAATPEADSVIIAQPGDKAFYFHKAGMMAPMGTHRNYSREPQAVLLLNRSLAEARPGVYAATVPMVLSGEYDVELMIPSTRTATCVRWTVAPGDVSPAVLAEAGKAAIIEPTIVEFKPRFDPKAPLLATKPARLKFDLRDLNDSRPVPPGEISVLIFRAPAGRTWRLAPSLASEDGQYEVSFVPDLPGQYRFLVAVEPRGVSLGKVYPVTLGVVQ